MVVDDARGLRLANRKSFRAMVSLSLALLIGWSGLVVAPAMADPGDAVLVIDKTLTTPGTVDVGDAVSYTLDVECSSQTDHCVTATITDVLDSNLELVDESHGDPDYPIAYTRSGQTLTWNLGEAGDDELRYFQAGFTATIKITAKVKSVPAGDGTISNTATGTSPNTAASTSDTVKVTVNPEPDATYDWGLRKVKEYPRAQPGVDGTVRYLIQFTRPRNDAGSGPLNKVGADITSFDLTDILPDGAIFVPEKSWMDGTADAMVDNGDGTISIPDAAIKAKDVTCGSAPCVSTYAAHITVKYPAASFHAGDTAINTVSVDNVKYRVDNPAAEPIGDASASVTFGAGKPAMTATKYATTSTNPKPGQSVKWVMQGENSGNTVLADAVLIDTLPGHLTQMKVGALDWYMPSATGGTGTFEYYSGGAWHPLGTLSRSTGTQLSVPDGATQVRMTVHNQGVDDLLGFGITATVAAGTPSETVLDNCIAYDGSAGAGTGNCASYTVKDQNQARVIPSKAHVIDGDLEPGDEFWWNLDWRLQSIDPPATATVTDLLPAGFELVEDETPCLDYRYNWEATPGACNAGASTPGFTPTPNPDGTTLLTFADIALPALGERDYQKYSLHLKVRVKDGVKAGTYTNTMAVSLPGEPTQMTCGSDTSASAECPATDPVTVITSAGVGLQKWDLGPLPTVHKDTGKPNAKCPNWEGFTRYPCVAQTEPDGSFTYRLRATNQGNVDLRNETIYDVLPFVGDAGIGQTVGSAARGSEWSPQLDGPVTLVASLTDAKDIDYVVEYSTSSNPCRPELKSGGTPGPWQSSCDDVAWVTSVGGNWASVKSFRIRAFTQAGALWAPKAQVVFEVPMKAPADQPKSSFAPLDLSIAWNAIAQRATGVYPDGSEAPTRATEPLKVGIIIAAPVSIGDFVWYDTNENGRQDDGEPPVPGVHVKLTDASGATVGETDTDAQGYYWFTDLLPEAKYTLTFTNKPSGYSWTSQNKGASDAIDSDVNPKTGTINFTSPRWEKDTSHNLGAAKVADDPTLDGGIVPTKPLVSVGDYVWFDSDRDGLQDSGEPQVAGVTVNLYDSEGQLFDTTVTDSTGHYWFTDLVSGQQYTIEFVQPANMIFTGQDAGTIKTNSRTGDVNDSDADPATGKVVFTAEATGSNLGDATHLADNPGIDAGFLRYDLTIDKVLQTTGKIRLGDDVTYTLTPENLGEVDALGGWSVSDLLPAGLTLKSMSGTGYTCDQETATCTNASILKAGTKAGPVTVVATVGAGLSGQLKNVAWVTPYGEDPVPESNLLAVPELTTDTAASPTNNDDEAVITLSPYVSIGDYVWWDHNRDGLQTAGEPVYAGMTVNLLDSAGSVVKTTTTNAQGYYAFTSLEADTDYTVEFVKLPGENFTTRLTGDDRGIDSNADVSTGRSPVVHTPVTGANSGAPDQADDHTIDAGLFAYNLQLDKKITSTGPYYEGWTVTFELTPRNEGPSTALGGWSVTDILPTGLTLVSMTGDGYRCSGATCINDAPLAAGEAGGPITVTATINAEYVGHAHNVAYVSPSAPDGVESNVLAVPTRDTTDTTESDTDNDAQADIGVASLVSIGDYVWFDTDRNGQQDEGEDPVSAVTVNLYRNGETTPWKTTTTNEAGFYSFNGLTPNADYIVEFIKPANTTFTSQDAAGVADSADSDADASTGRVSVKAPPSGSNSLSAPDDPTFDAGLVKLVSVGDYVWYDDDRNGAQDEGEAPVDQVTVNLYRQGETTPWETTTTNASGFYSFTDLEAGASYTIEFVKPAGTAFTRSDADGVANTADSDADTTTGRVAITAPADGANSATTPDNPSFDAGLVKLVSVGDYVWWDNNRNGQQDAGEPAVGQVTVNLYDANGALVATTTTNDAGFYSFVDLMPAASYTIEFVKPNGTTFTDALTGDTGSDSNADPATGRFSFTTPAVGLNSAVTPDDPTIDAGLVSFNLTITKTRLGSGVVHKGDTITYTLVPHNDGPSDTLAGWTVTELPPDTLTILSMTGDGYDCADLTCVAQAPLVGGEDGPTITVKAKVVGLGSIVNTASVEPNVSDAEANGEDNSADAPVVSGEKLAYTGAEGAGWLAGLGVLLALGGGLLVAARRRRLS